MMMSFISLGFVGVLWAVIGYSLAFGTGGDWLGDTANMFPVVWFPRCRPSLDEHSAPALHVLPGHVLHHHGGVDLGAIVERMRFPYVAFITLWALVVYSGGALGVGRRLSAKMGAVDFVTVGRAAALVAAIVVDRVATSRAVALAPHNVAEVHAARHGSALFGWFGFNAGSALAANGIAALAFTTTMLAPAGTLVVWALLDTLCP